MLLARRSVGRLLNRSVARGLAPSFCRSLGRSVAHVLSRSLGRSLLHAIPIAQEKKRVAKLQQDAAKVLSKVVPLVHALNDVKKDPRYSELPKKARSKLEQPLGMLEKQRAAAEDRVRGITNDAFNFSIEDVVTVAKASNEALKTTNEILKSYMRLG